MDNIIWALTRARAVIYAIAYIKHICILTTKSSSTTTKVRARSMHTPNTMHKYYSMHNIMHTTRNINSTSS